MQRKHNRHRRFILSNQADFRLNNDFIQNFIDKRSVKDNKHHRTNDTRHENHHFEKAVCGIPFEYVICKQQRQWNDNNKGYRKID